MFSLVEHAKIHQDLTLQRSKWQKYQKYRQHAKLSDQKEFSVQHYGLWAPFAQLNRLCGCSLNLSDSVLNCAWCGADLALASLYHWRLNTKSLSPSARTSGVFVNFSDWRDSLAHVAASVRVYHSWLSCFLFQALSPVTSARVCVCSLLIANPNPNPNSNPAELCFCYFLRPAFGFLHSGFS